MLLTTLLVVNLFLTEKGASISPIFAKSTLGGPDNSFVVLNQAIPSETSSAKSFFVDNATLTNLPTPGTKVVSGGASKIFTAPTTGWNWGILHNVNAVDIANECGTPIFAAAEGLVSESVSLGWNSGYGSYIKIQHATAAITLYAHLSKNSVLAGTYVFQGDEIGLMGNTGNTHGPTGCHLHFEVRGAVNPFAK